MQFSVVSTISIVCIRETGRRMFTSKLQADGQLQTPTLNIYTVAGLTL